MFPTGDLEEFEVQCAGELSARYDEFDNDELDEDDISDDGPLTTVSPGLEIINIGSLVDGAPPTPPISASETSSPGRKRFSLPLPTTSKSGDIPIAWTRPIGLRQSPPRTSSDAVGTDSDREASGRKRCLQLDLRGVTETDDQDAYHLG
jgi:hypothetical protein